MHFIHIKASVYYFSLHPSWALQYPEVMLVSSLSSGGILPVYLLLCKPFQLCFFAFSLGSWVPGSLEVQPCSRLWVKCALSVVWCPRIRWSVVFIFAQCQHCFHLPKSLCRCWLEFSFVSLDEYTIASSGCSCQYWQLVLLAKVDCSLRYNSLVNGVSKPYGTMQQSWE